MALDQGFPRHTGRSIDAVDVDITALPLRSGGAHRLPAPPNALRGRATVVAVAAGAAVSAGNIAAAAMDEGTASIQLVAQDTRTFGTTQAVEAGAPTILPVAPAILPEDHFVIQASMIEVLQQSTQQNIEREHAEELARRPQVVAPTEGVLTSGFGARWGTIHGGIDIANAPGTGIVAVQSGNVVDAGPAQGFGNWVRIVADDGTMTVYGHMDSVEVQVGQYVSAGQRIAGMGSRGFSTGCHLHFEVHLGGTDRVDPLPWLAMHGIVLNQ